MLLRRVMDHVKDQNWVAVFLDFLIVVIGVIVGLQFSNWNDNRASTSAYRKAMERLAEETADSYAYSTDTSEIIENSLRSVQAAILALEQCEPSPQATRDIEKGLNHIRATVGLRTRSDALELLVKDDALVRQQKPQQRETLREYGQIYDRLNATSKGIQDSYSIKEIEMHPAVEFSGILAPEQTLNRVDVRRAHLAVPVEVACADNSFTKNFYWWERIHVFQLGIHRKLRKTIVEHNEALDLPAPVAKEVES